MLCGVTVGVYFGLIRAESKMSLSGRWCYPDRRSDREHISVSVVHSCHRAAS